MRADRLLSILLPLQVHRRLSARGLAARLEVSERTIYRDMEALGMAGVPVLGERGASSRSTRPCSAAIPGGLCRWVGGAPWRLGLHPL